MSGGGLHPGGSGGSLPQLYHARHSTPYVRYYHPELPTETHPLKPLALLYDQFGRFLSYQMVQHSALYSGG
ncbi:hypothetical protein I7I48_02241 [Histoplasma ohiense]|nr:hypothetical protein I7I48_02241 [Histoplasma ohiense (nom. inval.)]